MLSNLSIIAFEVLMNDTFLVGRKLPNFNLKTTKRDTLTDSDLIGNRNIIFIYPKMILQVVQREPHFFRKC